MASARGPTDDSKIPNHGYSKFIILLFPPLFRAPVAVSDRCLRSDRAVKQNQRLVVSISNESFFLCSPTREVEITVHPLFPFALMSIRRARVRLKVISFSLAGGVINELKQLSARAASVRSEQNVPLDIVRNEIIPISHFCSSLKPHNPTFAPLCVNELYISGRVRGDSDSSPEPFEGRLI